MNETMNKSVDNTLEEEDIRFFLEVYEDSEDTEVKAALLQYQRDRFGGGFQDDLSL